MKDYLFQWVCNELMRIAYGISFPYQVSECFIQSLLAIYMVQHNYKYAADYDLLC